MIESTITSTQVKSPFTFPLLAKCIINDSLHNIVVLFTDELQGTVVKTRINSIGYSIGYHSEWEPVTNDKVWEILPVGTVINLTVV